MCFFLRSIFHENAEEVFIFELKFLQQIALINLEQK